MDELSEVDVVGHRVVHGGPDLADPVLITAEVKDVIAEMAPDHNPAELSGIESIETALRHVPQVVAFDTAFIGPCRRKPSGIHCWRSVRAWRAAVRVPRHQPPL